jgi:hypothetical protein
MSQGPTSPRPANDIEAGRRRLAMTNRDLWVGYFEAGGNGSLDDVAGWLAGRVLLPPRDHDYLALTLNEAFGDQGLDHPVPYSVD